MTFIVTFMVTYAQKKRVNCMINVIEDMRNEFKIKLTEKTRPG